MLVQALRRRRSGGAGQGYQPYDGWPRSDVPWTSTEPASAQDLLSTGSLYGRVEPHWELTASDPEADPLWTASSTKGTHSWKASQAPCQPERPQWLCT